MKNYIPLLGALILFNSSTNALMPKKLPNGKPRGFLPNYDNPREDLQMISAGTASLISKNWMQNILIEVMYRRRSKNLTNLGEFIYDDLHIVSGLQDLQRDIDDSQRKLSNSWGDIINSKVNKNSNPTLYFAWKPKSLQGFNEVLFIVVATLIKESITTENEVEDKFYLNIKNVIQSPFWDEEQVKSIYLKKALIDQNEYTNETTIRFDELYQNNFRYKLAWETWLQENNDL